MASATATTLHNKTWAYFIDYDVEEEVYPIDISLPRLYNLPEH